MEYIDFQNTNFAEDLTNAFNECIEEVEGKLVLNNDLKTHVYPVIKKYSGFENIKFNLENFGNMAVDTGYFSPNHVINIAGLDTMYSPSETTLYRWFKENRGKVFRGEVNLATGKVEGAFCTVPVNVYINRNIETFLDKEEAGKYGVSMAGMLAGVIIHEIGHIFGACMLMCSQVMDNMVIKATMRAFQDTPTETIRMTVLKDAADLLDLPKTEKKDLEALANSHNEEDLLLFFNKMIVKRNANRTLSVGVQEMTCEVMADLYCIRMGFSKELTVVIAQFVKTNQKGVWPFITLFSAFCGIYSGIFAIFDYTITALGAAAIVGSMFTMVFVVSTFLFYFGREVSGIYNTDQRRFEDAIRQLIAKFRQDKLIPNSQKKKDLEFLDQMLKLNESYKTAVTSTTIRNIAGWIFAGSDFKYRELEHFTQQLNNHEINLLSSKIGFLIEGK